jgi:diguanylate cyclase (GGDEF)-like protein/PAS domain S-box-containing protein
MLERLKNLLAGSLQRQLTTGLLLIVASMMSLFIWEQTRRQQDVLLERQAEQAVALARSTAAAVAVSVASRDFSAVQEIIQGLARYPELQHAIVLDPRGQVLAHTDATRLGLYLQEAQAVPEKSQVWRTDHQVDVLEPVRLGQQPMGTVRIRLGLDTMQTEMGHLTHRGLEDTLLAVALSLVVATLAGRHLTRRLRAIRDVADAVQAGQSDQRADESGQDEAAQLARQFNRMLDSLAQRKAVIRDSERKLFLILESVDAHIYLKGADGRYLFANRSVRDVFGVTLEQLVGQDDACFVEADSLVQLRENDRQVLEDGLTLRTEETNLHFRSGHTGTYLTVKLPLRDEAGRIYALCGISTDITERKAYEKELEYIAHYDTLTRLPNRVLLGDRLQQALVQSRRSLQQVAVIYLDLDGFKAINDRHGHATGDQFLIAVAARMREALREGDTLARLGGDEFVAVLPDLADFSASSTVLQRLLGAAAQPVPVGELLLQVTASLGVTFYPQADEVDADQLLRQADQAMYQAKLAGKNRYHVFDAEQDRHLRGHHESVERIRRALAAGEFVLHYQPKVHMRTGRLLGAEALIRWQHPEQGLLLPALFLPVIESHPLAIEMGQWVINTALTQIQTWHAAGWHVPVSVNVSAIQLQQADFVERLREALAAHPAVKPACLALEVLETSALEDLGRVSSVIEACRAIGVLFALDDFGTGYSSLTYLKRLAVAQIKIDQSFVRDMLDDPDDLAILEGVLDLASAFHREVIAEGVETVAHGTMLLQLGCEWGQGYGIARPMPPEDLPGWAGRWQPDPAWVSQPAVPRDDLPLIFAGVAHRAWIRDLGRYLQGEQDQPPELDIDMCSFGHWLAREGQARHARAAGFAVVVALHQQTHALATQLCELHVEHDPQALAQLGELHALGHRLQAHLMALLREPLL